MTETIEICSIPHYIYNISLFDYGKYKLFRGESQDFDNTKLISKIGRANLESNHNNDFNENHEIHLLNWFKNEAPKYVDVSILSDIEYLIIGQHYGLRTRLLDFTLNPLIALYFAVKDSADHDGFVYVSDESQDLLTSSDITSKRLEEIIVDLNKEALFIIPTNSQKRISNQSGVLALIKEPKNRYTNIESVFCIPAAKKKKMKSMLYKLNIHEETVFQNLDSLCQSLNYRKFEYNL